MTEHLNAYLLTTWSANILLYNMAMNLCYLIKIQFSSQYHYICKLCIESQCFYVADVELSTEVYLLLDATSISKYGDIHRNHRTDASFFSCINNGMHLIYVIIIDNGVNRKVTLDTMLVANGSNLAQISYGERVGRMGTHIELSYPEIYRVGSCLNGSLQGIS